MVDSITDAMRCAPIWLLWKAVVEPGKPKPRKVPYYINGAARSGILDSPDDRAQLGTYEQAVAAYGSSGGAYAGLAIALGPDGRGGYWQGIDLDDMLAKSITDIADLWTRGPCAGLGYVEMSPSGNGIHLIGYGRQFKSLGSNSSGIEAYAGGRFFTFTQQPIVADSPCRTYDLAEYVEQALAQRHGAARSESAGTSEAGTVRADPKTVTELRSALLHMRSDDRDLWVAVGQALKELGDTGRGLWMDWSATSEKFDPKEAAKKWASFDGTRTGYQAVFKKAQDAGWVNPASKAADLLPRNHAIGKLARQMETS
ncbi:PriCT-2 domain-containing protein, partial [Sandaracinobacter sp. RS1-74]|uniref:PriCT-2 domain-containing protein n=1 Tax=Sandaracinobacteroides sayramensis TaxID=2913411 RepID=UPI001EDC2FE8